MNISGKNKSWAITLIVAGGAVGYVWGIFLPGQKTIGTIRDDLRSKQTFAVNLALYNSQTREAQTKLEETRSYVDQWQRVLVTPADMPRLYAEIAEVAKRAGVVTTRFSPDPPQRLAQVVKFPVNLGCEGSFGQVGSLVEGLERLPYRVWLERVSVEAEPEGRGLLRCEINLEVFAKNSGFSG